MNDLDRTRLFFDSLGILYAEEPGDVPDSLALRMTAATSFRDDGSKSRVVGYSFFFTEFVFDSDGDFVHVGIWE
jgi:hypothetical protein